MAVCLTVRRLSQHIRAIPTIGGGGIEIEMHILYKQEFIWHATQETYTVPCAVKSNIGCTNQLSVI